MSIYIGEKADYSAMQGPCDDGFHIPTSTEMSAMWTMLQSIIGNSSYNNLLTYLRMPLAGMWEDWGGTYGMGSAANYYTCSTSGANAIRFFYNSGGVSPTATINREYAFPIRPFKDTPVVPDSSWTNSYTSGNKKISINTTLGLISMTSNGQNWLTIADKNVGATTVYTSGATLSQSNCGKYFQWGNNYGFPFSGTITKSSTKVNASTYGPGNYYNSSTFITGGGDWSTVQNDNLWGATTGVVQVPAKIKNCYIGESSVKAVYIGTTKVRPSGPNLDYIAHYPLESDVNDTSGNGYNGTISSGSSGISYIALASGKKVISVNYAGLARITTNCSISPKTISFWVYKDSSLDAHPDFWKHYIGQDDGSKGDRAANTGWQFRSAFGWQGYNLGYFFKYQATSIDSNDTTTQNKWVHLCATDDGSKISFYQNGVKIIHQQPYYPIEALGNLRILTAPTGSDASYRRFYGMMSEVILLNNTWTDNDVLNYYNSTKIDYGL